MSANALTLPGGASVTHAHEVLATHGRTFRAASLLLAPSERDDAALLYAGCREIDDAVDEAATRADARANLARLRAELDGEADPRPLFRGFLDVFRRREIPLEVAHELTRGVASDLGRVRIEDDAALLRYCYRVAGTVGLMMCRVLGVTDARAHRHAIDLGIAMQLTNICRDVLEDTERDRVYLPATRLAQVGVAQDELVRRPAEAGAAGRVVRDLLRLAEAYYASGLAGLVWLPPRARAAIGAAARMYRAIGLRVLARDGDFRRGRVWVGPLGKLLWSIVGVKDALLARHPAGHDADLHQALRGLPGAAPAPDVDDRPDT